ncbi:MAG: AAA family ATPase [Candidatus Coatesbacteria bacterium]
MPSRLFIKRLELSGFKTFVRRTTLNVDAGMTGIVGPNGCGKSNIIDAVRWVLGEQSAKALRAARMEELVFHGSEREKPVGMAEVTLTLDNESGVLSKQGPEISLTRRLYRSGESEYLINRSPVRLKDITDLILDTGITTGAYVIMEQGKIDSVLTARPTERMALFEEAAGVMRYQQQKEEAERKLAATQQNLVRVADIVHELKRQLDSLERQAKAAEQYQEMRKRVQDLRARARAVELARGKAGLEAAEAEAAGAHRTAEAGRAVVAERAATLRAGRERLEGLETRVREIEAGLARAREGNVAVRSQLEALRLKLSQAVIHREERERSLGEALASQEKVTAKAATAREEASKEESRLTQVRVELEEFMAEVKKLEESLASARSDLAGKRQALGTQADRLHQQPDSADREGALKTPIDEFRQHVPGLEWPLIRIFQAGETRGLALQAALGALADAAVVETWAQAEALLKAWREQREAPLTLVVLEAMPEPGPRRELPAGAIGWADEVVACPPKFASLARAILGDVAVFEDERIAAVLPGGSHVSSSGVKVYEPGIVWWPGSLPASAASTGTELAMLLAAAVRELGGIEARIVELEADLAEARRFESAARIEQVRLEQSLSGRLGERESLEETATESAKRASRLQEDIAALAAEQAAIEADLHAREDAHGVERRREDELTGQLFAAQDDRARVRDTMAPLEDEVEDARAKLDEAQQAVLAAEGLVQEARTRFELVRHDFEGEFGADTSRLDELAGQPLTDEESSQLGKLEHRLAEMGEAVNLLALDEFKDLGERHAEYQRQIEDLRASREKLQRAIYRLDRESERRFERTFTTIRENFHTMFRRLFGGGEADLKLVETEEKERGIEIEAKPPGKRTQSIALLSGGEKALTSTALLFALYMTKPSPFCFLDELDAPLDDANTDRFMKILKEFNGTTQFILITHNKHTMELADSLYGITMEDPGVSKVVSVRLSGLQAAVPAA